MKKKKLTRKQKATEDGLREYALKKWQSLCKHDKGYTTNTGKEPSVCINCGKAR